MAWSWFVWRNFCVFILFTLHLDVLASNDYNLYQAEFSQDKTNLVIKLLDGAETHHLWKRSVVSTTPPSSSELPVTDNRTNQQVLINNTKKPETPTKNSKKPILEANPNKLSGKNLGENGHGIRKNYTSTEAPLLLPPITSSSTSTPQQNITEDDDATLDHFSEETLKLYNITETKTDSHMYYNSSFVVDPAAGNHYWVDMENNRSVLLSKSHRRAATVKLSFDFPFYDHLIRNITVATGGFIYTGEYVHSWLAATQYIAPLMANFDTSLSNNSYIKYVDNGTAFTVQWERVSLQDRPKDGEFTFQVTLLNTGDIIFVYKTVPVVIVDDNHPVKVGLSDAYIIERTIFCKYKYGKS